MVINGNLTLPTRAAVGGIVPDQSRRQTPFVPQRTTDQQTKQQQSQTDAKRARPAFSPDAAPAVVVASDLAPIKNDESKVWRSQIPTNALFYDEVSRLAAGLDQPGTIISVRV